MKKLIMLSCLILSGCCEALNHTPIEYAKIGNCTVYMIPTSTCGYPLYSTICPGGHTKTRASHSESNGKTTKKVDVDSETSAL